MCLLIIFSLMILWDFLYIIKYIFVVFVSLRRKSGIWRRAILNKVFRRRGVNLVF